MLIPVQITPHETLRLAKSQQTTELRQFFEVNHFVRLPNLLQPELLKSLQEKIESEIFKERVVQTGGESIEMKLQPSLPLGLIMLLTNCPRFFSFVEEITGATQLSQFVGRIYRCIPGRGHKDFWHNDMYGTRKLAMSINLSQAVYKGGTLQLRVAESPEILCEVENLEPGSAVIFKLDHSLEHRITDVTGEHSKTAFAGWFSQDPPIHQLYRQGQRPI